MARSSAVSIRGTLTGGTTEYAISSAVSIRGTLTGGTTEYVIDFSWHSVQAVARQMAMILYRR
jgi:hypothetical protein